MTGRKNRALQVPSVVPSKALGNFPAVHNFSVLLCYSVLIDFNILRVVFLLALPKRSPNRKYLARPFFFFVAKWEAIVPGVPSVERGNRG